MFFYNIVHKYLKSNHFVKNVNTSFLLCRDNYVGKIDLNNINNNNLFICKDERFKHKSQLYNITKNKKIVILLESPHIKEFSLNLIAPALGRTGLLIEKYLINILKTNQKIIKDEYDIYIVNAICYQCSLGYSTKQYRNQIFKAMWGKTKVQNSLKRRIKKIHPDIVINAITKQFKETISGFLNNNIKNINNKMLIFEASSHPSVWNNNTIIY